MPIRDLLVGVCRANDFGVGEGLYARWGCSGELAEMFTLDEEGGWTALEVVNFGDRFTITLPETVD